MNCRYIKHQTIRKLITAVILFLMVSIIAAERMQTTERNSLNHDSAPISSVSNLVISVFQIDDDLISPSKGNGDQQVDAGETIQLRIEITNNNAFDLTNCYGYLNSTSTFTGFHTYYQNQSYGTISSGAAKLSASYYVIYINSSAESNTVLSFSLYIIATEGSWLEMLNLTVQKTPQPVYAKYEITNEYSGDLNAIVNYVFNAGEEVSFRIYLENLANAPIFTVVVALTIENPYITVLSIPDDLGDLSGFEQDYCVHRIRIAGNIADKAEIHGILTVEDMYNTRWNISFAFIINGTPLYTLKSYQFKQYYSNGNGDNFIDGGEIWELSIDLQNNGTAAGNNIFVNLSKNNQLDPQQRFVRSVTPATPMDYGRIFIWGNKSKTFRIEFMGNFTPDRTFLLGILITDATGIPQNLSIPITLRQSPILNVTNVYLVEWWGDDDNKIESDEDWYIELVVRNIGGGIARNVWIAVLCNDEYLTWDYTDLYYRNKTISEFQEFYEFDGYYDWGFSISDDAPKNHVIVFEIIYGFQGVDGYYTSYARITANPTNILQIENWSPWMYLLLVIIGLVVVRILNAGLFRKKLPNGFRALLILSSLVFSLVMLGFFMYYLYPPYSIFLIIPVLYFFFLAIAVRKSIRRYHRGSSREPISTRIFFGLKRGLYRLKDKLEYWNNDRKYRKLEKKAKREASKENLPNLIHLAQHAIVKAHNAEEKQQFSEARKYWQIAEEKTEKAIKKALDNADPEAGKSKLKQNLVNIQLNFGLTYVNQSFLLKSQGKEKITRQEFSDGAQDYLNAANELKKGLEYFKKHGDIATQLPSNLSLSTLTEKAEKYETYSNHFKIKAEIKPIPQEFESIKQMGQDKAKIIDARKLALDLLQKLSTLKSRINPNEDSFGIIPEIQNLIEEIRNFQKSVDSSLDSMLGVVKITTNILDFDDDFQQNTAEESKTNQYSNRALNILREYEFLGGKIRFKIKLANNTGEVLTNLKLTVDLPNALKWIAYEPDFNRKGDTLEIPKLGLGEEKTISLYLSPINCINSAVNASLTYFDARDTPHAIAMSPKTIRISCPLFFTPEEANIARIKSLNMQLPNHDRKVLPLLDAVPFETQVKIGMDVVGQYDIKFVDRSDHEGFVEVWYYGVTKIANRKMIIYLQYNREDRIQLIEVAGENQENITALLAELENQIRDALDRYQPLSAKENFYDIKTSVVLGYCPYCYEPIPRSSIADYQKGHPVECTFCKSQIIYYD
jgi:hypothetical protein